MLEALYIEATEDTPKIVFDKENNLFEITGRSLPEDATTFFMPILKWVSKYTEEPNPECEFRFDLEYFNSSSASKIVKILLELEKIDRTENKIKAIWLYKEGDDLMKDRGIEIQTVIQLPIEIKEYA